MSHQHFIQNYFWAWAETALAPLQPVGEKKMRHFEPFRIRWGTTQQANISWTRIRVTSSPSALAYLPRKTLATTKREATHEYDPELFVDDSGDERPHVGPSQAAGKTTPGFGLPNIRPPFGARSRTWCPGAAALLLSRINATVAKINAAYDDWQRTLPHHSTATDHQPQHLPPRGRRASCPTRSRGRRTSHSKSGGNSAESSTKAASPEQTGRRDRGESPLRGGSVVIEFAKW